jgi:hypothetical protein
VLEVWEGRQQSGMQALGEDVQLGQCTVQVESAEVCELNEAAKQA